MKQRLAFFLFLCLAASSIAGVAQSAAPAASAGSPHHQGSELPAAR